VAEKRVLIVHDDATFVSQVKGAIEASGAAFEVTSALSGPRALGMVNNNRPDVIVVDAELVGMDGYTVTKQLKSEEATSGIPVIIVSLQPTEASALKARQAGAAAHMPSTGPADQIAGRVVALAGADDSAPAVSPAAPASSTEPPEVRASAGVAEAAPAGYGAPQPVQAPAGAVPPPPPPGEPAAASGAPEGYGAPSAPPARPPMPTGMVGGTAPVMSGTAPIADGRPSDNSGDIPHIDDLLRLMIDRGGSDLHITVGSAPGLRLRGELMPVENHKVLSPRDTQEMILNLLSEEQRRKFETELELDFAYSIPGVSRFRANVFQQRNSMGAVFRVIPIAIPTLEDLGLPKVCKFLAERPRGLVLVTGPTGSGKSTTLAAMIDHINATRADHIITLEDPIEFMHKNKKSFVNQREVGEDTHSFTSALKRVLRQDPDVILVGEMRDLETIAAAITAAETGHLVLATLHTTGGPETVDRIIDVFPPHQQQQVRMQLSNTLEGVLSQVLLRTTDGRGRCMAMEIMLGIPAISNLIREGKTHQMATIIQGGASLGMQTLDQHLKTLLQSGKVTFEEAIGKAQNPRELAQLMGRKI